jgi:hypothetical protein
MATTAKTRGRKGARQKPAARSRRVAVAKAKSGPRVKAARRGAAVATVAAEAPVRKSRTKALKPARSAAPSPRPSSRKREAPLSVARRAEPKARSAATAPSPVETPAAAGLTDEERIESAKYEPRRARPRVFEEERFLFPQTYGVNRLRLLVKDPEWLFAYWDVDPRSLESLRADLGARASALSQLTLRVFEDRNGGESTFLLPQDARTWYVQARVPGRAYRAEVGVMLPSGEFRSLARSNSVITPRGARSAQKAKRAVRYDRARPAGPATALASSDEETAAEDRPWSPPLDAGAGPEQEEGPRPAPRGGSGGKSVPRGGASDTHRR